MEVKRPETIEETSSEDALLRSNSSEKQPSQQDVVVHHHHSAEASPMDQIKGEAVEDDDEEEEGDEKHYPHGMKLALIISSLCLAIFSVSLDQTIIAPALGAITGEYGTVRDIGWYGAAYLLTNTVMQPISGAVYRLFDIKAVFLGSIAVFEIGSLLCALARSSAAFVAFRALAGAGSGAVFSGAIIIISRIMPLEKRPLAFGLVGGTSGIASVAGPLLGGVLTEKVSWRWCFWINLPIGCVSMVVIFFLVSVGGGGGSRRRDSLDNNKKTVVQRLRELDLAGAAIFIPAIISLILALQWGGTVFTWNSSRIVGLFVGFALMMLVFAGIEQWQGDGGMLPPPLFRDRNVVCAMVFAGFSSASFLPLIYYLSIYFQAIQGVSALAAGIKIIPLLLSSTFGSITSGVLISVVGYYNAVILPFMSLMVVGAGLISTFGLDTPTSQWLGYQVITGLGVGASFQVGVIVVQTVLPAKSVPVATGGVLFFQSLGGAVMIAVAQSLFETGFVGAARRVPGIDPAVFINAGADQIRAILERMGMADAIPAVLEAYLVGLRNTFYLSVGCAIAAFVACLGLQWKSVKQKGKDGGGGMLPPHGVKS